MASSAELLLDTSAALALVDRDHIFNGPVRRATRDARLGLSGHAWFETYSVLTRRPLPSRLSPDSASRLIETEFGSTAYLSDDAARALAAELVDRQVAGGSVFDALVAAAAREADVPLITCDARAERTYRALGVSFVLATR